MWLMDFCLASKIKMRNRIIILIISFFTSCLYAQTQSIDSLKKHIASKPHADTNVVHAISNLVKELINNGSYSEAIRYNNLSIEKSKSIHFQKGLGIAYLRFGIIHTIQGDYEKAISKYYFILSHFKNDQELIKKAIGNMAIIYYNQGNYSKALEFNLKALQLFEKTNDKIGEYNTYLNIGSIHHIQDNEKALGYYEKALVVAKELNDSVKICTAYGDIGLVYGHKKMFEKSLMYLRAVLAISEKKGDKRTVATTYNNIANVYEDKNEIDSSLAYHSKSLKINKTIGDKQSEAICLNSIGLCYLKKKKNVEAKQTLIQALNIFNELGDLLGIQYANNNLSKLYETTGNSSKAFEHYKKFIEARDSTFNEANTKKNIQSEMNYEFDKKQLASKLEQEKKLNDIKLQNEKRNSTKNIILIITIGLFLIVGIIAYVFYRNNKQKQALREFEKNELKQKLLLSQMNPHFIFNSVDHIQSLIGKKDEDAKMYLHRFSKLTRQILEYSRETHISLEEEKQVIENYISIQQLLYDNNFTYQLTIADNIETEAYLIPPMLTQPFIENAIKHGLKDKKEQGKVAINFYLHEAKLFVEITDNGTGFIEKNDTSNHKSLAMKITKERLGEFANNIIMENILSESNEITGAKIKLEIPYIYEK